MTRLLEADEARQQGLKFFRSASPCRKHPDSLFYTSNRVCVECQKIRDSDPRQVASRKEDWAVRGAIYNATRNAKRAVKSTLPELLRAGVELEIALQRISDARGIDIELLRDEVKKNARVKMGRKR